METASDRIKAVLLRVPEGRVASYGGVAVLAKPFDLKKLKQALGALPRWLACPMAPVWWRGFCTRAPPRTACPGGASYARMAA